jgi:hypothetical protein
MNVYLVYCQTPGNDKNLLRVSRTVAGATGFALQHASGLEYRADGDEWSRSDIGDTNGTVWKVWELSFYDGDDDYVTYSVQEFVTIP